MSQDFRLSVGLGFTVNPSQGMEETLSRNAGKERGIGVSASPSKGGKAKHIDQRERKIHATTPHSTNQLSPQRHSPEPGEMAMATNVNAIPMSQSLCLHSQGSHNKISLTG